MRERIRRLLDTENVKKTLIDAIPQTVARDHKDALRARIRYGNEFSLRKRLDELAARLSPAIRTLIFGPDGRVPQRWVDTRNYYSHWDQELRANILDGQNADLCDPANAPVSRSPLPSTGRIPETGYTASTFRHVVARGTVPRADQCHRTAAPRPERHFGCDHDSRRTGGQPSSLRPSGPEIEEVLGLC